VTPALDLLAKLLLVATNTPTGVGSHSVAADPNLNSPLSKSQVYVPIRGNAGQTTTTTTCGSKGGNNTNGCIAVFDAP
jgi:hypothetical protein